MIFRGLVASLWRESENNRKINHDHRKLARRGCARKRANRKFPHSLPKSCKIRVTSLRRIPHFGDLRFCLPTQSTSGWTTRMCLVSASLREKVFSSVHRWQRTFCLRELWIVSSCRVRSYGREKIELQGLPVLGLIRSHRCGPACELRKDWFGEDGDDGDVCLWPSLLCF